MQLRAPNLPVFGTHDESTLTQIDRCTATGVYGVLCADGHYGYSQPIGGVVAYENKISISGVGFDIACGCLAMRTDVKADRVIREIDSIMLEIVNKISFGVGRVNNEPLGHPLFNELIWDVQPWKDWKHLAYNQLGSIGSGNHYVDLLVDENEMIWVGVHFGSRGLGHKTATYFLKAAGGKDGMDVPPCVVGEHTPLGSDYLAGMKLAGEYAYAGREYVAFKVVQEILRGNVMEQVHNHHNFSWKEHHFGATWNVVRKGATPAFPGQRGFVGGSMGDNAVIIEGIESELARASLYSTVHGAGRVMSRGAALGKSIKIKDASGRVIRKERGQGLVRHDEMQAWLKQKGVTLVGGDLDEAPQAYRRLSEVLAAHAGTIRVLHELRPIGVAMAGNIIDPYKD